MPASPPAANGRFPTTQWTLIERLHHDDVKVSAGALNELCATYHYPLYCFIRKRGLAHHDAQDALHDFLAKLLRLDAFGDLEQEKGRLRTFLLKALDRSLITRHHREHKRADREMLLEDLPFDLLQRRYESESMRDGDTPERLFDKQWCAQLLERVLQQLAAQHEHRGRRHLFEALRPVLVSGGSMKGFDTEEMAAELGLSEGALRTAVVRMLREYRELLRAEVRQTVKSSDDVDAEIADLMGLFAPQ